VTGIGEPVLLVPGFMAGDSTLNAMSRSLRAAGFRTYRSHIRSNVRCTVDASLELEARVESIAIRRGARVHIVGHSLGGMLARGLAVRRLTGAARFDVDLGTVGAEALATQEHRHRLERGIAGHEAWNEEDGVVGRDLVRTGVRQQRPGPTVRPGSADQPPRLHDRAGLARQGSQPGGAVETGGKEERTER